MKLRWKEFTLALIMAVGLWYGISGSEKVETQIEMRVDYRGIPADLAVYDGLVNKVVVRVRAPMGQLRTLSLREYPFAMDLSSLEKGENILPIRKNQFPFRGSVEVIEVTPAAITLKVDSKETRTVPVVLDIVKTDLSPDYVVEGVVEPHEVELKGPATIVSAIDEVHVRTVITGSPLLGDTVHSRIVMVPEAVSSTPSEVAVTISIDLKRKEMSARTAVELSGEADPNITFEPAFVTVKAMVPNSQATQANIKKTVHAVVKSFPSFEEGVTIPVEVEMPETFKLISVEPENVIVHVKEK